MCQVNVTGEKYHHMCHGACTHNVHTHMHIQNENRLKVEETQCMCFVSYHVSNSEFKGFRNLFAMLNIMLRNEMSTQDEP